MNKWRYSILAIPFLLALIGLAMLTTTTLSGSAQGNAGDVWVDNVGQPPGPGHEQDPHLQCSDINLWGNGLADSSGTFTISSWPPSGNGATAYGPAPWTYDTTTGGDQVLAVIPISALLAGSAANGDTPQAQQGLHFKLQFLQDPQKHKTFWVDCAATSPTPTPTSSGRPTPTGSPSPTETGSPTPTGSPSATATGSPSPTATSSPSATTTPTPTGSAAATESATPTPSAELGTLAGTGGGPGSATGQTIAWFAIVLLVLGGLLFVAGTALRR